LTPILGQKVLVKNIVGESFPYNRFPIVVGTDYPVTLGPYGFYWLELGSP